MHGVLFIIDNYKDPYAGTEGQLYHVIKGLDRQRFKPKLILFQPSEYIEREGFPCEVEVLHVKKLVSPCTWLRLWRFARQARRDGYRLAHIFFNDPSIAVPVFLKTHGLRVLVARRDMGFWHNRLNLALLRFNRHFVDGVIANSEAVKQVTHERERFRLQDIYVIANGYPAVNGTNSNPRPPELTEAINSGGFIVGLVANIRPIKRIHDAIEAVAVLQRRNCPVSLIVLGSGDASALEELAQQRGVEGRVYFLGARRDVERFLPFFSVGLLCSESEGFSNTIIEYLRAGLPVICSAAGGNTEVVRDGENGYLYPVGHIQKLSGAIQRLAQDPVLRVRLSNGAVRSASKYTMEKMLTAHADLYEGFLTRWGSTTRVVRPSGTNSERGHYIAKGNR